jgi:hypothetical protein
VVQPAGNAAIASDAASLRTPTHPAPYRDTSDDASR